MSAPRVVRTADGMVWTRRAVTRAGLALYAPEGVCQCPEYVMATQAELAEHGLAVPAPVSRPLPAGDATCESCGHDGAEHQHSGTACWASLPRGKRADGTSGPVRLCECKKFVPEESAHAVLRHRYLKGRDLPPLDGVL